MNITKKKILILVAHTDDESLGCGGIYLKQNLSLKGDLNDILNSMSVKILRMMKIILKKNYTKKTKRQSFEFQKT